MAQNDHDALIELKTILQSHTVLLEKIEAYVEKTNGRVNQLERLRSYGQGMFYVCVAIAGFIGIFFKENVIAAWSVKNAEEMNMTAHQQIKEELQKIEVELKN